MVQWTLKTPAPLLCCCSLLFGCGQERPPDRLLVPQGYRGGIVVEYGVDGAPPLKREAGHLLLPIPPNGYLKTSTRFSGGWASDDDAYFVDARGKRTRIPSPSDPIPLGAKEPGPTTIFASNTGAGVRGDSKSTFVMYFVGTAAEAKSDGARLTGPMSHPFPEEYGRYRGRVDRIHGLDLRSAFKHDPQAISKYLRALATAKDKPKDWGAESLMADIANDRSTAHSYSRDFIAGYEQGLKVEPGRH